MRCGKWKKSLGIFLSSILLLGTVFSHVAWAEDNPGGTANDTRTKENEEAGTEESINIDAAYTKSKQQSTEADTAETAGDEVDIADANNTQNTEEASQPEDTQENSNTENNETTEGQEPGEETNEKEDVENTGDNQNTEASDIPTEVLEESQQLIAAPAAQAVSASSFLLRWETWGVNSATNSVEIHYVDASGKPLEVMTDTTKKVGSYATVTLSDYATPIPNYTYHVARLESQMGNNISYLRRSNEKIQYSSNGEDYSTWKRDNILKVYLIYSATTGNTLSTVETIDSKELGVEMTVFDYNKPAFSTEIGKYVDGSVTQGLLERKLDEEGYPLLKGGSALKTGFDKENGNVTKTVDANHLFLESAYDQDKTFYYSSFENYARLRGDNFTVYDQIGTVQDAPNFFYMRGNFMPFNDIADNELSANVNSYDEFGNALSADDPGYGKPLFLTQGDNNFLFGMKLQANFTQPKDGVLGEGRSPMRFEFNGDDDMWVFIDGMLVLDIGGIHDAHTGYIDFSTGEVAVNVSGTEYSTPTTIKAQMLEADNSLPDSYFRGNTLSNYSLHSIQVFYMERGEGASNCKFKFNLPVVPRSNVNIQKEVISDDPDALADDYHFQLYVQDGDEEETYRLASNYTCTVYPAGDGAEELQKVGPDGILTLKNGEWAAIKEAGVDGLSYYVKEVGVNPDYFNEYRVNGELITAENCVIQDGTMQITGPTKILGSDYNYIMKFQNIKNKSKIKVIKTINDLYDINGDAIFTFAVQNVSTGETLYRTLRFTAKTDRTQEFEIDGLPYGEYIVTELPTLRYTPQESAQQKCKLTTPQGAEISYHNDRTYKYNYSHTDVVVNHFTKNENGEVVIAQDRLGGETGEK